MKTCRPVDQVLSSFWVLYHVWLWLSSFMYQSYNQSFLFACFLTSLPMIDSAPLDISLFTSTFPFQDLFWKTFIGRYCFVDYGAVLVRSL